MPEIYLADRPPLIGLLNGDGQTTYVNEEFSAAFSRPRDSFLFRNWREFIDQRDWDATEREMAKLVATGKPFSSVRHYKYADESFAAFTVTSLVPLPDSSFIQNTAFMLEENSSIAATKLTRPAAMSVDVADYTRQITSELAATASENGMGFLGYLLRMASEQAGSDIQSILRKAGRRH